MRMFITGLVIGLLIGIAIGKQENHTLNLFPKHEIVFPKDCPPGYTVIEKYGGYKVAEKQLWWSYEFSTFYSSPELARIHAWGWWASSKE